MNPKPPQTETEDLEIQLLAYRQLKAEIKEREDQLKSLSTIIQTHFETNSIKEYVSSTDPNYKMVYVRPTSLKRTDLGKFKMALLSMGVSINILNRAESQAKQTISKKGYVKFVVQKEAEEEAG